MKLRLRGRNLREHRSNRPCSFDEIRCQYAHFLDLKADPAPGSTHLSLLNLPAKEDIFEDLIVPAHLLALTMDASVEPGGVLQ